MESGIDYPHMRGNNVTAAPLSRDLAVRLTVTDAVDGASRLLCDTQRFGFIIRSVHIDVLKNDLASVQMTPGVQLHADTVQICSRFARHVSVRSIEIL